MTIPKIELIIGSRNSENIVLTCTGCREYYEYSVRQYKGDFGCNISEFNQFLNWAMWEAAKHECFEAGSRTGYIEEPPSREPDDPLMYHVDFPQEDLEKLAADGGRVAERREDPFGEEAMRGGYCPGEFDYEGDPPWETLDIADEWEDLGIDDDEDEPSVYRLTIDFDYADLERRMLDEFRLQLGIYTRDSHGNLRDEKGRCLACLRSGVHRS